MVHAKAVSDGKQTEACTHNYGSLDANILFELSPKLVLLGRDPFLGKNP
jgi:hypothetical protein